MNQVSATKKIAVLGAGSWGTALALNSCRCKSTSVYLWAHKKTYANQLQNDRENINYLPGKTFPENLIVTDDISCIYDCDAVLLVVPSIAFNEILQKITPYIGKQAIAWAIKGFDKNTNDLLSYTFENTFPDIDYAIIAGPSFAKEVANALPTAITIASKNLAFANNFAQFMHNQSMRTYTTNDIIGAQVGGALKNVIAIAAGISDGLGFGANTRAALITRGLAELSRLGEKAGAEPQTLMGLSGLGDLLLTATDDLSRNRRFGLLLGKGYSVEQALNEIGQIVEGKFTALEAFAYAKKHKVRTPIINIIAKLINQEISVDHAMKYLLSHQPKPELE